MSIHIIKEKISTTLEAIVEQSATILESENNIHQIDIDLTLANIRVLYATFIELDKVNKSGIKENPTIVENIEVTNTIIEKESIPEPAQEPLVIPVIQQEIKEEPKEEIKAEPKVEAKVEVTEKMEVPNEQNLFTSNTNSQQIPKRMVPESKKSLFEQVAENKTESRIGDKLQQPVASIKQAIGINERYQFINTLFKGSQDNYSALINALDELTSLDEANGKLEEFIYKNGWEENNEKEALKKLKEILGRRYNA